MIFFTSLSHAASSKKEHSVRPPKLVPCVLECPPPLLPFILRQGKLPLPLRLSLRCLLSYLTHLCLRPNKTPPLLTFLQMLLLQIPPPRPPTLPLPLRSPFLQVSPRAIVRVLVRGSNYGTNSSRTVTTSCNPKDS